MRQFIWRGLTALLLLHFGSAILAQDADLSAAPEEPRRLPYEVVVNPTASISNLRNLFVHIEDDFFSKFNELNTDDEYDVHCYKFVPTGSHIPKRVCEPVFFMATREENAAEYAFNLGGCNTCRKPLPWLMNQSKIRHDTAPSFEILQEKLESFYKTDAEFNAIGEAMARVKARIENFSRDSEEC